MLTLVRKQMKARYRRMALKFLLNARCQETIVQSGGISVLVHVLSTERDGRALHLLLQLLHQVIDQSFSQELDLGVQAIVTSMDPNDIEFANLLLLVCPAEFAFSAARKHQFVLQASTNTLSLASSSVLHKYIALQSLRRALPEIAFAFVLEFEGIPLLWSVLMQSETSKLRALAAAILRWLANEDAAFRDHILEFCSKDSAVQNPKTKLRAAAARHEIFAET